MATSLPRDIIIDILSRLHPKPLCRFKCVAKSWNSLLNDPTFIKLHYSKSLNSKPPNLLICYDSLSTAQFPANHHRSLRFSALDHPVKHLPNHPTVQLLGLCNGLLCISDRFKKTLFLFNPATKTHRLVPPAPSNIPDSGDPLLTMYNPLVQKQIDHIVVFAFGYDSVSDDYKLARLIECYKDQVQVGREARLYSLKNNAWKTVKDELIDYPNQPCEGFHVNGILYFLASDETGIAMVKCLDLRTESFSLLPMFDYDTNYDSFSFVFNELGGCFCVMVNHLHTDLSTHYGWRLGKADLWVMKEHEKKESWVRLFSISDPVRIRDVNNIRQVLYSKDGGKILLEFDGCKYVWYDWGRNKYERVKTSGLPEVPFDTYTFVDSLVSLGPEKSTPNQKQKTVPKKNINRKSSDSFLSTGFKLKL